MSSRFSEKLKLETHNIEGEDFYLVIQLWGWAFQEY